MPLPVELRAIAKQRRRDGSKTQKTGFGRVRCFREANAHVQNLIGLYYRILARLIAIVQKVEAVLPGKAD